MLERRTYLFDINAGESERGNIITGRPIVYNSKTDIGGMFAEVIEPGALDGVDLRDVRLLVNHNTDMIPLARSRRNNGNSTMTLMPVPEGLDFEAIVDTENNVDAKALYSAVKRGDLSGMSFMYSVSEGDDTWENLGTDYPTRHINKIASVVEISATTFPAYESTEIYARSSEAMEIAKQTLESTRKRNAYPLESERKDELELLKAKFRFKANY